MAFIVPSKRLTSTRPPTRVNFKQSSQTEKISQSAMNKNKTQNKLIDKQVKASKQKIFIEQENNKMLNKMYEQLVKYDQQFETSNSCYQAIIEAENELTILLTQNIAPLEQKPILELQQSFLSQYPQLQRLESELIVVQQLFSNLLKQEQKLDDNIHSILQGKLNEQEQQMYQ